MPYYCTVPRCTSMSGKAKNVSFHQFPRDEELAKLWNRILKRGKPYTKYSKVCSLHFRPEDYTITSIGKNKGQWRTLRKDAIPSRNLPPDQTSSHKSRTPGLWTPGTMSSNFVDPRMQQQMAQAIYLQTMLAMQAAGNGAPQSPSQNINAAIIQQLNSGPTPPSNVCQKLTEIEQLIEKMKARTNDNLLDDDIEEKCEEIDRIEKEEKDLDLETEENKVKYDETENDRANIDLKMQESSNSDKSIISDENTGFGNGCNAVNKTSYQCLECSKCFKDPDVFILHKRTHYPKKLNVDNIEKENYNTDKGFSKQDTLKANPILANLLKSGISSNMSMPNGIFNSSTSFESQIMTALAVNITLFQNLSSMFPNIKEDLKNNDSDQNFEQTSHTSDHNYMDDDNSLSSNEEFDVECQGIVTSHHNSTKSHNQHSSKDTNGDCNNDSKNYETHDTVQNNYNHENYEHNSETKDLEVIVSNCDNQDLNDSKDSLGIMD